MTLRQEMELKPRLRFNTYTVVVHFQHPDFSFFSTFTNSSGVKSVTDSIWLPFGKKKRYSGQPPSIVKIFGFGPQQVIFLPAFCPKNICVTGRNTFPFALFTAKKKQNVLAEQIVTLLNTNIARMKNVGPPRRSTYITTNASAQKCARSYNSQNQNCNRNQNQDRIGIEIAD